MFYFSQYAHWLLRLMVSATFIYHSWGKFLNLKGFAAGAGLPLPLALLAALGELAGALLLLAGGFYKPWLTRIAALPLIAVMLVAVLKYHWGQWSFLPSQSHPAGGIEFPLFLFVVCLYMFLRAGKV